MKRFYSSLLAAMFFFGLGTAFSQTISTPTVPASICAGATFNVSYTVTGTYNSGNVYTAELSTSAGAFPGTSVGTFASQTNGAILVTIPTSTAASTNYVMRITSSNPVVTSSASTTFTIAAPPTISAPTFTPTVFCQGDVFTITINVPGCAFNSLPSTNVFTAQLSNPSGSFASGVTSLGTVTATGSTTLTATMNPGTTAGTAYRIRISSSNPSGIVSLDNGTNLTVNATSGTAGTAGSNQWYVSCYNGNNFDTYYGFYTDTGLNFDSQTRWGQSVSPSSANATGGTAYSGCPIPVDQHSYSYKRTGFPCGYYQINIPSHDDDVYLLVDGVQKFVHNGCCDSHTAVYTAFLGASSTVELRLREGGGSSYLSASFTAAPNPLITSTPPFVCSGTTTTLTASSSLSLNYAWTSSGAAVSPTTGSSVTSAPTGAAGSTTTYTVVATDPTTSCTLTKSIVATIINSTPVTAVTPTAVSLCPANPSATLTASGANNYSWSPTTGLSIPPGPGAIVTATPSTTTTYTVTGNSGGCAATSTAMVTVTVPTYPASGTAGNGFWNVFVYGNTNYTSYLGNYTENSLSFNTTSRWAAGTGPGAADNSTGQAYQGCTVSNAGYSISYKRTGFTCGAANANYVQIDIPSHDDDVALYVNNVLKYSLAGAGSGHTNVWTGFLGPSSVVEVRVANTTGTTGNLQVTIAPSSTSPLTVNSPITVCTGTQAHLNASTSIAGVTYAWTPSANVNQPTNPVTNAGPISSNTTYTVTITDAAAGGTGCTASASVPVTVNATPTISISPAGPITLTCPVQSTTLTASGANNYFPWTPAAGLNTTSGFQVIATPSVTTTYTISGDNNCQNGSASVTIINPFPTTNTFPTNTWNVYGFNAQNFTGYQGYYTDNGSGTTGYDFNTQTRWTSGAAPSTANATNGQAWQGCTMPATNFSLSFKRTNFVCGLYTLDVLNHDDDFLLFINGVQVAVHNGCCDAHTAIWTGVLSPTSTVEWLLVQGGGLSNMQVRFTRAAAVATQSIWTGNTSTDWFTSSNWCSVVPTSTIDALIPAAGPPNMPVIGATGALARNLTINPAIAAGTYTLLIPAASLTVTGTNDLSVYGNWTNNGSFNAGSGLVTFMGATAATISSAAPQVFNNLRFNKTSTTTTTNTSSLQIAGVGTFTGGRVQQNGTFEFLASATTTGASNASYIAGPVMKTGTAAFVFPIGSTGFYQPLTISASAGTDQYTAQYFKTNPNPLYSVSSKDASLNHVSTVEYWTLVRNSGSTDVTVNLAWNGNSAVTSPLTDLRVAGWDGTAWRDKGNGSTTGTSASGSITSSAVVSTYGPFTLASVTASNPLPIELSYFTAKYNDGVVMLEWRTESQLNNDYFTVQRAVNVESFEDINKVQGAGTTTKPLIYSMTDTQPIPGVSYYRLKQTDFDKTVTYSKIVAINITDIATWKAYPNPTEGSSFNISFSANDFKKACAIKVQDINGNEMFQVNIDSIDKTSFNIQIPQKLTSGMYIVSVVIDGKVERQKLIVK